MAYTMAVNEKNPSTAKRAIAPALGIHLPCFSDTMATPMLIQMNTNLKA